MTHLKSSIHKSIKIMQTVILMYYILFLCLHSEVDKPLTWPWMAVSDNVRLHMLKWILIIFCWYPLKVFWSSKSEHALLSIFNSIRNAFQNIPWTLLYTYKLVELCFLFLDLFYIPQKTQKQVKLTAFPWKLSLTFQPCSTFFFTK